MNHLPIARRTIAVSLAALSTAAAVHAQPRIIYTDAHASGVHDGASWQTAFRDLQDALYAASGDPNRNAEGIEIHIAQGVYTPDHGTMSPSLSFTVASSVTLMGGFAGMLGANPDERDPDRFVSVLSGDLAHNDGPGFTNYAENSTVVLRTTSLNVIDGVEISGGNGGSQPTGVIATGYNSSGAPTFRNCSIVRNRGGVVVRLSYGATFISSRINENQCDDGTLVTGWNMDFRSCEFRGNRVVFSPSSATRALIYPRLVGSTSFAGFTRCLIADNICGTSGAIYSYETGVDISLEGCTIANNSSYSSPVLTSDNAMLHIRNSIIAGNIQSTIPIGAQQISAPSAAKLDINASSLVDNGTQGIRFTVTQGGMPTVLSGDPRFVAPAGSTWVDNDYRLRPGSPAIDRADSSQVKFSPFDLNGKPIYDDPNTPNLGTGAITYADLGAFEFDGTTCRADINHSGAINVADIFDFLNAWFAGNPATDIDDSGSITVADIFAFINAWFGGC